MVLSNTTSEPWLQGRYNYTTTEWILHRGTHAVMGLLTIFSAFTNIIVIYVFSNKKFGKRTVVKYLYANISLSDELFTFACLIQVTVYGVSSCSLECRRFLGLTITISGFVSAYTMALIAFKRYYGIAFPFKEMVQNRKKLPFVIGIVVIWMFSIVAVLYFMRYAQIREYHETLLLQQCNVLTYTFVALKDSPYFPLVGMVILPLAFGLFFSLLTIVLLQRKKAVGDHVDIAKLNNERKIKLKATIMITVIIVSFIVCWLPVTLLTLVDNLSLSTRKFCDFNYNAYGIVAILLMVSFFINPIIYWYMCPDFRRGIEHILNRKRKAPDAEYCRK